MTASIIRDLAPYKNALKAFAFQNDQSKGRKPLEPGYYDDDLIFVPVCDPFELDAIKIRGSLAYRRLFEKTQVFPSPMSPHIRNRGLHTNDVISTATLISETLGLNTSLVRAGCLGHDLGHAPFGHFGERWITKNSGKPFHHAVFSVIISQLIERQGAGLNLCWETLLCILHHSRTHQLDLFLVSNHPLEFNVVMFADKISYVFADIRDWLRFYPAASLKGSNIDYFGKTQRERVANCIIALIKESAEKSNKKGIVSFSESETAKNFVELLSWMYENVYNKMTFTAQEVYFSAIIEYFKAELFFNGWDPYLLLALMTDDEVLTFGNFYNINHAPSIADIKNFGIIEIVEKSQKRLTAFSSHGLDW